MDRKTETEAEEPIRRDCERDKLTEVLIRKRDNTLILKRVYEGTEIYGVLFGEQKVGTVYQSGGAWHWRVFLAMPEEVVDKRGRADDREGAAAAFREVWDQLQLARRIETGPLE